jgi:hypothetical protein
MTRHRTRKKQRAGEIETSVGHDLTGGSVVVEVGWCRCGRGCACLAYRGLAGCGATSSGGDARGSQAGSGQHGLRLTVSN